jgi:hypothetical protein
LRQEVFNTALLFIYSMYAAIHHKTINQVLKFI